MCVRFWVTRPEEVDNDKEEEEEEVDEEEEEVDDDKEEEEEEVDNNNDKEEEEVDDDSDEEEEDPTPRKALSVRSFVRWSQFLPHLTQTHTPENVR